MRIYAVNLLSGVEQQPIRLSRRIIELQIDTKAHRIKRTNARRSGLELVRNGSDVTVTNYGLAQGAAISGQPLAYGTKHAWLEHQDLVLDGQYLLRWEAEPSRTLRDWRWWMVWPAALFLLPFCLMATFWIGTEASTWSGPMPRLFANSFAATATPTSTGNPLPTHVPVTPTPPTQPSVQPFIAPVRPTVTVSPSDSVSQTLAQATAAASGTVSAVAAATAAAAPPAPCVPAPVDVARVNWDPDISMWIEPACVRPGEQYWRLVRAEWLTGEQFRGYHHLFVDVQDEDGNRLGGSTFVMSWPDGKCKLSIGQGLPTPIDHGNNCPMFSPAESYKVWVEGLPSDAVNGLGLGAARSTTRPVDYMTSFFLLFRRDTYRG
jgi:hypothetical protein